MSRSFEIQPLVRSMKDDDGAVLLDLKAGKYYSLNGVGSVIWTKIEEGLAWPEVLQHLANIYPAPPEQIERDASEFIDRLTSWRLLRAVGHDRADQHDI